MNPDLAGLYEDAEAWQRFLKRIDRLGLERSNSFWLWKLESVEQREARWKVAHERVAAEEEAKRARKSR